MFHVVIPRATAVETGFAAAVGHVNAEELGGWVGGGEGGRGGGSTSKEENSQEMTRPWGGGGVMRS